MRTTPKLAETKSVDALLKKFADDGLNSFRIPREIEDKPDALLDIGGKRIACECVQIPPAYIYQFHQKKLKEHDWEGPSLISRIWPNEPHQWIAEAVIMKAALNAGYLSSTCSQESWLLIHAPDESNQYFVNADSTWIQFALRHGAKMHTHPFQKIFLWTPQSGIREIYDHWNDRLTHSALGIEFGNGYPTICTDCFRIPITPSKGTRYRELRFSTSRPKIIISHPIDAEYRRHEPAHTRIKYDVIAKVWSSRAEVTVNMNFLDRGEFATFGTANIENLASGVPYFHYVLHEYRSPKRLNTIHHIQEY